MRPYSRGGRRGKLSWKAVKTFLVGRRPKLGERAIPKGRGFLLDKKLECNPAEFIELVVKRGLEVPGSKRFKFVLEEKGTFQFWLRHGDNFLYFNWGLAKKEIKGVLKEKARALKELYPEVKRISIK